MVAKASGMDIRGISTDGSTIAKIGNQEPPAGNEPEPKGDRPSWLPEKFNSVEDFAKSYAELEAKLSDQKAPDQNQETKTPEGEKALEALAPTDMERYRNEFIANGGFSEKTYEELAAKGLSREFVDSYAAGQVALDQARVQEGYSLVGGEQQYKAMVEWARANMSPAEIAAYNSQANGSREQAQLAIQGLQAKFQAAVGKQPQGLLSGGAAPTNAVGGFTSRAQVVQAMSDERYAKDPAFRQSVMQRLAVTDSSVI
jgi:hypothetical protein